MRQDQIISNTVSGLWPLKGIHLKFKQIFFKKHHLIDDCFKSFWNLRYSP